MDNPVCASCHKGLSLEEIERGSFKQLGGRLYCAECVAKMRRVGPVVCSQCGTHDTPLYDGKHYVCRKCGAQVQRSSASIKAPAARPKKQAPRKKCPYCGAVLAAESLKCRYCGSSLTRDARDLDSVTRQNLRLRFWLGCLLTASVFLVCLLAYLVTNGGLGERAGAVAPPPARIQPATSDRPGELAKTVADLQRQIAGLQEALAEASDRGPSGLPVPRRPKTSVPPDRRVAPPAPKPTTAVTVKKPQTKVAPNPPAPDPPQPKGPDVVKLAAAAYPAFQTKLKKLRGENNFAEAIGACRQFLAVYVDTPQGKRVSADQKALRAQLEQVRDDHIGEFRDALAKGDLTGARGVVARLGRYNAPEIRDDRSRMLAEIQAAERQPERNRARYLTQWETPTHIQRLLTQLRRRDDRQARANAAKELGRHQHSSAIGGLLLAIDDPDWYTANCAIKALGDMGDPIALTDLAERTKASHPGVYDPAAQACRTLAAADRKQFAEAWGLVDRKAVGRDLIEALTLIDKEESNVTSRFRIALIDALAALEAKQAVPAIRALRKRTGDEAVRATADAAIAKLTGADLTANAPPKPPTKKPTPEPAPPKKPGPAPPKPLDAPKPGTSARPAPSILPKPPTPPAKPTPAPPRPAPTTKVSATPTPTPKPAPPTPKAAPPKPKPATSTAAKPTPPKPPVKPKPTPPTKTVETPKPPTKTVEKPKPKPPAKAGASARPTALSGTIQPSGDPKAVTIGLPADHGLAKGDRVELATGGRPLCVVEVASTDKTRVTATILKLLDKTPPAPDTIVSLTPTK